MFAVLGEGTSEGAIEFEQRREIETTVGECPQAESGFAGRQTGEAMKIHSREGRRG